MTYTDVLQFEQVGTHESLGALNLLARTKPPPVDGGLPLGVTFDNQPFFFNPLQYHRDEITGGTSMLVLGSRGSGKTTLLKSAAAYESLLANKATGDRQRISIDDTRSNLGMEDQREAEWRSFIEDYLGSTHTNLSGYRLNILDPKMKMRIEQQLSLLQTLCQMVEERKLTSSERVALIVGLGKMDAVAPTSASPVLLQQIVDSLGYDSYQQFQDQIRDRLLTKFTNASERDAVGELLRRKRNMSEEKFSEACSSISEMLLLLIEEYDGIFGAEHSLHDILSDAVVGLDFTQLSEETIPLVEVVVNAWRDSALSRDDFSLTTNCELHDENWSRWESLPYARAMITRLKHIRGTGTRIWRAMHRPSDVEQVGSNGSKVRELARNSLRETDIVFIGRMPKAQHESLKIFRDIPPRMLDALPGLGKGQFLVLIGDNWAPFFIQVVLDEGLLAASYTDSARDRQL